MAQRDALPGDGTDAVEHLSAGVAGFDLGRQQRRKALADTQLRREKISMQG
ncbi:hypothetical protein [Nocardia terpenica]|uniref:Uncharacterized protein n=1 Tax=Nocardia terpenica TaxID=455432 RepID=A0A6G9Z491_9NOCA|nr:hypothetical protein [Nocardia terpenica]QIS20425.1 hypothetical protein F6W96_21130 [Nocardia terpenica]